MKDLYGKSPAVAALEHLRAGGTFNPDKVRVGPGEFWHMQPTPAETIARQVAEAIAIDREGKIRAALIALGWTPPSDVQS